jgi:hypothetical protein
VWDALITTQFARKCAGSEKSRKTTRYRATNRLLDLIRDFKTRDLLDRNLPRNTKREKPTEHALVHAHDEAEVLPLPESLKERQEIRKLEKRMALVNEENLRHEWRAFVIDSDSGKIAEHFEPNVCFRIVYSKELGRGGRMYSWSALSAQQIPKAAVRLHADGAMASGTNRASDLRFGTLVVI